MVESGKNSAARAADLLTAGQSAPKNNAACHSLRICITAQDNKNVTVTIPLLILKFTTTLATMGLKCIPEEARKELQQKGIDLAEIDFDELACLIEQGLIGNTLISIERNDEVTGYTKIEVSIQ